jgi:poly(A) polymerase
MRTWLKNKLSGKKPPATALKISVIPRDKHDISRRRISNAALSVIKRLHGANFDAYLVGGGVRDLQLGGSPKDFDVATNATPEQVHSLFKGSRIVGRRFRIVHVRHGREIIEVTTFRGSHDQDKLGKNQSKQSDTGMLLRDNVYGSIEEDAIRRDFTVNALYYNPENRSIYDFTGGLDDLRAGTLKLIGDPETRYREDPVRMLRAARFAAKLRFNIDSATESPISQLANLLEGVSSARLFDEMLKLFQSGYGERTFLQLRRLGLYKHLFSQTEWALGHSSASEFYHAMIVQALQNTDERIESGKSVTPAFIIAAMLWPPLQESMAKLKQHESDQDAYQKACQQVINGQLTQISIPKRFTITVREIWDLQFRLPNYNGKRAERTAAHPRFRAAYDFLLLRESAGEDTAGLGAWWTDYQQQHPIPEISQEREYNRDDDFKPRKRNHRRRNRNNV